MILKGIRRLFFLLAIPVLASCTDFGREVGPEVLKLVSDGEQTVDCNGGRCTIVLMSGQSTCPMFPSSGSWRWNASQIRAIPPEPAT